MSLNRSEQYLCDYVLRHPEERHYWQAKVRMICKEAPGPHVGAVRLARELARYGEERRTVDPSFRDGFGPGQPSLRNLAEYWIRLWIEPKPRSKNQSRGEH